MIDIVLKIVLITVLITIFWQDVKDRMVYWFLYALAGILGFCIHSLMVGALMALTSAMINIALVSCILLLSYSYTRLISKKRFINESIGSGDILFFVCLPFAFSITNFIVLFVVSLIFALFIQSIMGHKQEYKTVPLAGFMALFFSAVYTVSFFIEPKYLFSF